MDIEKQKEAIDNFFETKIAPLDKNKKLAICLVSWLLPLAAFGYFSIYPTQNEINSLESRRAKLEKDVNEAKRQAGELDKHKAEKEDTTAMLQKASILLPKNKEIPTLLTNISSLGTSAGLEFLNFQPMPERPMEFYAEIPVSITVSGPYHGVGSFLYDVSKLDRIVSVSNINIGSPALTDGQMMLNSTFNLVTYKFIEEKVE